MYLCMYVYIYTIFVHHFSFEFFDDFVIQVDLACESDRSPEPIQPDALPGRFVRHFRITVCINKNNQLRIKKK